MRSVSLTASTAVHPDGHGNHPRLPARQRRQRAPVGLQGSFSLWGRLREFVAGVAWRRRLLLCAGEAASRVERHSHATRAANPRTAQEGRRGPAQKLPQASWPHRKTLEDRAVATENPEAALEAVPGARDWTPRPPPPRLPGATDGNHGESTGTYSNRTLGGTDFRVEPPEHTSCSLLRSRRCSDPNPAPVGDTDWLWFQVIGQKRDSRQVRRKRLGSNSASSPPQIPVPRGKPCRQESHIWRRCRRLKWSLGHWNCRHTVSAARRPGCCAAHRWTEAITRFLVLWAVVLSR